MKIVRFNYLGDYRLHVFFNDGIERIADLSSFLKDSRNPLIRKFLDVTRFQDVQLDKYGVLVWGDDEMDISPESIYQGQFSNNQVQSQNV